MIKVLPPKIAKEVIARERERKARITLIMALPKDHLEKFHKMADAKEMWEAIKTRFGGNDESKKMQKYLLKQQFKGFSVSSSKGLHKGYDRFQTLLSQLEIHGAGVLHEDANQKFLRSIPSSWSQVALIMRTKPRLDTFSFDDLYNNLRVFERDFKGTTASSSNTQNVAFVSAENTSSTNDVAMISMRIKKFHKRTGRKLQFDAKDLVSFDKTKVECFNCHKVGHFAKDYRAKGNQDGKRRNVGYNGNKTRDNGRRPVHQDDSKALVTINEEDIDWFGHVEEDAQNYAIMAYSSSNLGSDNESVFMNKASDLKDTPVNDRFADEMHAVPPLMTRNFMPSGPDVEIDYSKFTYWNKAHLADYQEFKGGSVAFGGSNGRITVENQANKSAGPKEANNSAGTQANNDQGDNSKEIDLNEEHFILPIWSAYSTTVKSSGDKIEKNTSFKTCEKPNTSTSSTNQINTASTPLSIVGPSRAFNDGELSNPDPSKYDFLDDPLMPHL
nr:ribonuclease H-like domain-containing protein [Tanacetum cinerariifolium]